MALMTKQELFDKVATHLMTQGKKSGQMQVCTNLSNVSYGTEIFVCKYRGPEGTKCAAGAILPDEKYLPSYEGKRASYFFRDLEIVEFRALSLLDQLQNIHDNYQPKNWKQELQKLHKHQLPEWRVDTSILNALPEIL